MAENSDVSLPFSQACENNKSFILDVLKRYLTGQQHVLEIGSGTAQHITFFAKHLPSTFWLPTELPNTIATTLQRLKACQLTNILPIQPLNVEQDDWSNHIDAVYTANTLHIMSWQHCLHFIRNVARILPDKGLCFIYGPFNYQGEFTSESNKNFDQWLKNRDSLSGIRDFNELEKSFNMFKLFLVEDAAMPANNRVLIWEKRETQ